MNHDEFTALRAFADSPGYYEPSPTISMAETSLLTPSSPQSYRSESVNQEDKKPTKKRKSWGQELPTPKTNLPPRKRAKTEDEKEQRRIERVLRNRQAAQSSRERKRLEVEKLEGEKYSIERQNFLLKQQLLKVEQEKSALRQQIARMAVALGLDKHASLGAPSAPLSPSLMADVLSQDKPIKQELEEYPFALPSPRPSPHTVDPRSSFSSASSSSSRSPSPINMEFDGNAKSSDLTQHPAEVLCDLPCQSEDSCLPSTKPALPLDEAQSAILQHQQMQTQQALSLLLMLHSTAYTQIMIPLSQLHSSLMDGSPLKTTMTPMLFSLIQWLTLTPANLTSTATSLPSTSMINTTRTTSTSSRPSHQRSTFRTSLLRRLLTCSPALARPLKDATGRALHMKTRHALCGNFDGGCSTYGNDADRVQCCGDDSRSRREVWRLMSMVIVIDQFEKQNKAWIKSIQ